MSVVYNPPEPHKCEFPSGGGLRNGAIAQCAKCRRYGRLDPTMSLAGVSTWTRLDPFAVLGYMLIGRIPTPKGSDA